MDKFLHTNPLEAVQFVSIFSYLNSLSDFLFIENYLTEGDQRKQIPVVNALYNYLDDNNDNEEMKIRLIRKLLQGSDLYGEKNNENFDVTFVNAMFEYIVSSLVFDKYGNIYGFLAHVVEESKCFQLNSLHREILKSLKNAKFENEYGEKSTLSDVAVRRIFIDIIRPFFPQTTSDINILSIDYIYAQAGSIFLRSDGLNNSFYAQSQNFTEHDQEKLFEQYLVIGHLLRNTLNSENIYSVSFKAFALPALIYNVYLDRVSVKDDIFDNNFWKVAFLHFYSYLDGNLNEIKDKFSKDTKYRIHSALLEFKRHEIIAKSLLDVHCKHLNEKEIETNVREYIYFPGHSQCGKGYLLPNLTEVFMQNVKKIGEMYKIHDMEVMQQSFGETFLSSLDDSKVVIQLLAPNDKVVLGVFDNSTRIPYDLIVFYYPDNSTLDFYALIRENYTATLIKEVDDPTEFQLKTGLTVDMLLSHRYHRVTLKTDSQTMDVFWENFMTYKVQRLTSYLKNSGNNLLLGEWWSEFGLSLMPFYSCIEAVNKTSCELNEINFSQPWSEDISSELVNSDIRPFLVSLNTTFKNAQLFLTINKKYNTTDANKRDIDELIEKLVLHMEEPGFDLTYLTLEDIDLIQTVINSLKQNINNSFKFVINILNKMTVFKSKDIKIISYVAEKENRELFIRTENTKGDTGYGYRFAHIHNYTAQLRTDYQFKKQIFVTPLNQKTEIERIYFEVNSNNEQCEEPEHIFYETNNQLRSVMTRREFKSLYVHDYNIRECNSDSHMEHLTSLIGCPRHVRSMKQRWNRDACLNKALSRNTNLTRDQVLETIGKYTFPDGDSVCLQFVEEWTNNRNLTIPPWIQKYTMENSPLLSSLRYQFTLDSKNLSILNGTFRIFSTYPYRERRKIENGEPMKNIITDFNNQQTRYVATFEDYYAIRNFATTGYTRITGDTFEAKQMKTALYKLAIRQSDDPDEDVVKILFRFETKLEEIVMKTITIGRCITLQKFTATTVSKESALKLAPTPAYGFINILYEFWLPSPYVRAEIKEYSTVENTIILLPGTEFKIAKTENLDGVLIVSLEYITSANDKYNWYKKIMNEISKN